MKNLAFTGLETQKKEIRREVQIAIDKVIEHGNFILGPEVSELEEKLAKYCGARHCISCANGTDAIQAILMALGVDEDSEIITAGFSYISVAEAAKLLGAKIKYVDVNSCTFNMDPSKIEDVISHRTKAIVPVSLFGQCADFDRINLIAQKYNIPVIEDGAQSFGASYKGNKSLNLSSIAFTSFFPSKPLGCYGDGGAIFTSDDQLAEKIRKIARHGQNGKYNHEILGINSRLDTIQAAILLLKLRDFDKEMRKREFVASLYSETFINNGLSISPFILEGCKSAWAQYTIKVRNRDLVKERLKDAGIPTAVYYPKPLNEQASVRDTDYNLPVSKNISETVLSIPMNPYFLKEETMYVAQSVIKAVREC